MKWTTRTKDDEDDEDDVIVVVPEAFWGSIKNAMNTSDINISVNRAIVKPIYNIEKIRNLIETGKG